MPYCSILECKNDSRRKNLKIGGVSYHRFPKDSSVKEKWIDATGRINWMPSKSSTICLEHFLEDDFIMSIKGYRYTKPTALPSMKIVKFFNDFTDPVEDQSSSGTNESETEGRASTCRGTKLIPLLKHAEDVIANVYHYLQAEYEELKSSIGTSCDLSPLANILQRTAAATGVSEHAVCAILEERKTAADEELEASAAKRAKLSHDYGEGNVSPSTDDESSREAPNKEQNNITEQDDNNEQTHNDSQEPVEFEVETLKVEIKEEVDEKPMDPLQLQMSETDSAVQHLVFSTNSNRPNISIATDVTNSVDDRQTPAVVVYPQSSSGVLRVMSIEPMTSLATVKVEPDEDPPNSDTTVRDVTCKPPLS